MTISYQTVKTVEYTDDWYCLKCHKGPMSDKMTQCGFCGVPVKCDPLDSYNDKLDADAQVSTEEAIAAMIFERVESLAPLSTSLDEEDCAHFGREILKMVLKEFRPDLFTKEN
jgi:hypothetical protein